MVKSRHWWIMLALIGAIAVSILASLSLGAASLSSSQLFGALLNSQDPEYGFASQIVWQLRMPRTLLALLAGGGLALTGLLLQTVTRNPLADPYLFGISSGASFGVVLLLALSTGVVSNTSMSAAAFSGSMLVMVLLLVITQRVRQQQVESMLLAGVALSFLFSALTSLLLYWTDPQAVSAILFWMMGSFTRAGWQDLGLPALMLLTSMGLMLLYRRQLTALLLGDESAATLGINVRRFRLIMLILSSMLTGVLVSLCGGIGFVGLMVPHIVRFFVPPGSHLSLLSTALFGGLFMLWVDILARLALPNQELPVGIVTAALGSVFFLCLLHLKKRQEGI